MSRSGKGLKTFEKLIKNNLSPSAKKIIGAIIFLLVLGLLAVYFFVIRGVGIKYALNDDGTSYTVAGIGINFNADIEISETYKGLPVTAIGDNAFSDILGKQIRSIKIPETVTSIGDSAFGECYGLTNIYYCGTEAEWNAIPKGDKWNSGVLFGLVIYNYSDN